MMGSMQALSIVTKKVSSNNFAGSAVLNLLHSQVSFLYYTYSLHLKLIVSFPFRDIINVLNFTIENKVYHDH